MVFAIQRDDRELLSYFLDKKVFIDGTVLHAVLEPSKRHLLLLLFGKHPRVDALALITVLGAQDPSMLKSLLARGPILDYGIPESERAVLRRL
jgi:hypothetical protein